MEKYPGSRESAIYAAVITNQLRHGQHLDGYKINLYRNDFYRALGRYTKRITSVSTIFQ